MLQGINLGPRRKAQAERLLALAKAQNVEILAHFYQRLEVKALASYVGGSLGIHQAALNSQAKALMLCGVDFLAESLERLRPDLKIIVPRPDAGCPFSQTVGLDEVELLRRSEPDSIIVADIKASGAVRDLCDLEIQTWGDPAEFRHPSRPIRVLPALSTGDPDRLTYLPWPGAICAVHQQITVKDLEEVLETYPWAKIAANSLCLPEVRALADVVGDSQTIFDELTSQPQGEWLVICETGLVEWLRIMAPDSQFYETAVEVFCPNMKLTNIKDMVRSLEADQAALETRANALPSPTGTPIAP